MNQTLVKVRSFTLAAVATTCVVALSACQQAQSPVAGQPASSLVTPASIQALVSPTNAPKVAVTVSKSGGFVEWGVLPATPHLLHVAEGVMYRPADPTVGTSILRGVLQRPLTAEQLVALEARMQTLGLFRAAPIDAGLTDKRDQGSLVIVATDGRGTYRHEIFAPSESIGITEEQFAYRGAINEWLRDPLGEARSSEENSQSPSDLVTFTALRLEVQSVGVVEREALEQKDNLNVARLWPLTDQLPEGCVDVSGEEARIVLDSLTDVTHETLWINDGRWVRIAMRGLLPAEPPCAV
jgi:hypothetical protein